MDPAFGPYRLDGLLGRGGMGEVYRARHVEQDRVVALKLLLPELSDDAVFRRRFLRESQLAAKLTDPHVIPVHGWGEVDGRLYLDMRFVDGEDLRARLGRAGPMPPAQAVAVVAQVARALDAAHAAGLVHRDVKPSNVLLATSGDGEDFAYLVDFGIARSTAGDGTTGGAPLGTLAYMAPERFLGAPAGRPADIYALACVLHETLTGKRPFEVDEPLDYVSAHLNSPPLPPSSQDPRLPPGFDAVLARGLAKDPAARHPTAGALAAAARAVVGGPAAVLGPRRPRRAWALVATAARAVVGGPAAVLRPRRVWLLAVALLAAVTVTGALLLATRPGPVPAPPTSSAPPTPVLADAERALLAALPAGFDARSCTADPERPAGSTAALRCDRGPSGVPGAARFARYPDVATLDRAVADEAARRKLPLDTGTCRDGADVQTTWTKTGRVAGLVACHGEPGGGRTIRWSDRRALALGVVTRNDGDATALYDWWTRYDFA